MTLKPRLAFYLRLLEQTQVFKEISRSEGRWRIVQKCCSQLRDCTGTALWRDVYCLT